ncbi:MAG TPA: type II secretion system protein GspL [Myxococcales bacterium]|jgi:general secretion pathway protein L|nr:type II secretion system protein GspL [Myxococcales bacterium]
MHRIVGLDLTADKVRLVALESGFRGFSVLEARSVALPEGGTPGERLRAALSQLPRSEDDTIAVALPGAQVASHVVTLPFTDARRIEQVLPAEVEGAIPFDLEDVVWDHTVLSQSNGRTEVLVGVVKKSALQQALAQFGEAGVDPRVVTFAPLALATPAERGMVARDGAAAPESGAATEAVLDAGPDRADFCVLDGGRPVLARSLSSAGLAAWDAARTDPRALDRLLSPLVRDVKMSLRMRGKAGPVGRLLLAGDLSALPGVAERLSTELSLPVAPLALSGQAAQVAGGNGADYALALGLALRAQQPRGRLNFRKGEFAFTKDLSQVRGHLARLGLAAGVLLVLAFALGIARIASLSKQARDYDDALCAATRKIVGTCMTDYRQAVAALSGGRSKAAGIPRVSAADVLAELVSHLPDDAMPTLEDVDLNTTTIRLRGTADSYGKVDQIITALKKDRCFGEIKQPRTEKQRGGEKVQFSIDFAYTCSGEQPGGA